MYVKHLIDNEYEDSGAAYQKELNFSDNINSNHTR